MALYTISDLHLPLGVDKPMDIFGRRWENYIEKLRDNWLSLVTKEDMVVMPGDFCWAMYLDEAKKDFDFINELPGIKILLKGNHDYWWDTVSKLRRFVSEQGYIGIDFLQNNCFMYENTAICGTRFWTCPGSTGYSGEDEKFYLRELGRAELSLQAAEKNNPSDIFFFTHYPPTTNNGVVDETFCELMQKYGVSRVLYGHLHGNAHNNAFIDGYKGIKFDLVSCDYLEFTPKKLLD